MHAVTGISVEQVIPLRRCRPTKEPELQQPNSADHTPSCWAGKNAAGPLGAKRTLRLVQASACSA